MAYANETRRAGDAAAFHVLIVDDDANMRAYFAHMLQRQAMRVETAADGESALALIRAAPPDLILLDVMLPGISGFDVCRRVKGDPTTALIPIVLVTGLEDQASRVQGIQAGADDFLSKPVNTEELLARVRTLRRLHETRKELEQQHLASEVARKEAIRKAFSRYVSPRLADRIIGDLGASGTLFTRTQRSNVVALFADLRGFTRLTERTGALRVVQMLNEYFSVLTEAAHKHEGTIFNMSGDSLFVGFNVPLPQQDAVSRAYLCAQDMLACFAPLAGRWHCDGSPGIGLGLGLCAGEAIIGNVGSAHYMSYTVIGNPVNTAARLMQMAGPNELLVCSGIYRELAARIPPDLVEARGDVALRGKSEPVRVYSIKGPPPA
jgi:adenylate cyclase